MAQLLYSQKYELKILNFDQNSFLLLTIKYMAQEQPRSNEPDKISPESVPTQKFANPDKSQIRPISAKELRSKVKGIKPLPSLEGEGVAEENLMD